MQIKKTVECSPAKRSFQILMLFLKTSYLTSLEVKYQSKLNSWPLIVKKSSKIDSDYILNTRESHNKEHLVEKILGFRVFQYLESMPCSS